MPPVFKLLASVILAAFVLFSLKGCQTTDLRGFTRAQTEMLRAQGFAETVDGWELSFADRLLFDVDSAVLNPQIESTIDRMARGLLSVGIDAARVEGHSDATGGGDHNARLSLARASVVAAAMQARGFPAANLSIRGHGEMRPIADNATEEGRAQNRRVVIIVTAR